MSDGSERQRHYTQLATPEPIERPKENTHMATEVKGLTDVVKDISTVKQQASSVAADLRKNMDDVQQALGLVSEVSNALKDAGAELRGALGVQTNNPPNSN